VDWPTFVQAWEIAWGVLDYVATAGGAAWVLKTVAGLVKDRLGRGRDALERNVHRWAQRGAWPYSFYRFLERDSWRSDDLGRLLGCSQEDAEAILALFGFAYDETEDLWRREGDQPAQILAAVRQEIVMSDLQFSESGREEFEGRLESLFQSGEPLPERAYDPEEEPEESFELLSFAMSADEVVAQVQIGGRQVQILIPLHELAESYPEFSALYSTAYGLIQAQVARFGRDGGED
jgi:hypothetical protein